MKTTTPNKEDAKAKKGLASSKNEADLKSVKKQTVKNEAKPSAKDMKDSFPTKK
ncbi:hypothetical protein [Flavobacterium mesophilum]|uniref:hypothetical protein n=1 Tax=Flavobacterium mesophilum TaxID=3143495 RepID=UPI0031CE9D75